MSIDEAYNFRRVDDRVTTSGFVTAAQLRDLKAEGYDAVVNLLPDGHDRAVPEESDILREQGVDYVYLPVDFAAPTPGDIDAFADAMDALEGRRIHVHCAANYRVSAFYGVYAQRRGWWSRAEADEFVRDLWDPAEHPAWEALLADVTPEASDR